MRRRVATSTAPTAFAPRLRATLQHMRQRTRTPAEWAYLVLWLLYLASYPVALIGVAFDVRPGFSMAWAGSILLFVQGALAVLWLVLSLGMRRGGVLALIVALGAFIGETVGVATGFPFGPYRYASILFPRLPGSVPLPVIGAWLLVVATSVGVARRLAPGGVEQRARQVALATILGVALDLVLEPVAVHVEGYWTWYATGPYYSIPTANFLGWAALCAMLAGVVVWQWPMTHAALTSVFAPANRATPSPGTARRATVQPLPLPTLTDTMGWLYVLTLAMFASIDLTHGLWAAGIGGVALVVGVAVRWHADV
jgi:uncharacterized membrane protein